MPIISTDILYKQSGASSLGGAISATDVSTAINGLFDVVSGTEALSGDTEYRCVYVKNNHGSLTLYNAAVFIQTNTPSTDTDAAIGVGSSAINGTEQTVANESTAPTSVVFSAPSTFATGLALGDLAPGAWRAVWIRRTVSSAASAYNGDGVTLAVQGDTAA